MLISHVFVLSGNPLTYFGTMVVWFLLISRPFKTKVLTKTKYREEKT